jgi:hypothetical protein
MGVLLGSDSGQGGSKVLAETAKQYSINVDVIYFGN